MGRRGQKGRMRSTPHPTLSPIEAERVIAANENAPKGAVNFFVHGVAYYATVFVLQRPKLGRAFSG